MSSSNNFFGIFTQLLRKIGVAIGPNEINPVREKCNELVEEMRKIAKEEATKVCLEQMKEVKAIVQDGNSDQIKYKPN